MAGKAAKPFIGEGASIVVVLELRHEHPILAIQRHRQQVVARVLALGKNLIAHAVDIIEEVTDRILGRHLAVGEGDAVTDDAVAENRRHLAAVHAGYNPWCRQI